MKVAGNLLKSKKMQFAIYCINLKTGALLRSLSFLISPAQHRRRCAGRPQPRKA